MSLLLFFIYWVVIPVSLFLIARLLFRRATAPLQKNLVVVVSVAVFVGLLWLAAGEKWWLDYQVRELCAKDGGVKVYETVKLPPELVDKFDVIRVPNKTQAKPSDEYYYESSMSYFRKGNPEMWQLRFKVYQRSNNKLLGETISYARRGGDIFGPWHESSFGCPDRADISDLKKQIFTKAD